MKKIDVYFSYDNKSTMNSILIEASLKEFFIKYELGFSLTKINGGFLQKDGTYIIEDSYKITIISDMSLVQLKTIVYSLKELLLQEQILVVTTDLDKVIYKC